MQSNSMINRILLASSALAMSLMAACNGPIRVPIQPQPQAPSHPVLVNPIGQLVLDQRRSGIGAQFAPLPGRKPEARQSSAEALLNRLLNPAKR
jgi:hypothetical protein